MPTKTGDYGGKLDVVPRERREALADLHGKLAAMQCLHCATVGKWTIQATAGRVRYVTCGGCGKRAKLATAAAAPTA